MNVRLLAVPLVTVNGGLGITSAPPSQQNTTVSGVIGVPAVAGLTVGVIDSESNSEPTGVNAEAEVTGATVSVPLIDAVIGGPILSTGTSVIRASADCGPDTDPSTSFGDTVDLRIAGRSVTLDVNGAATVAISALGLPVGTVSLRTDVSTTSTETAEATALIATVDINVLTVGRVTGEVRIADASCEKADEVAVAPTVTGITPDEGPVAGGQTVTITGTGFISTDTRVVIQGEGAVPAGDVTVIDDETIEYITPPHAAGPVEVYVSTPVNTTTTLDYTYVDDDTPADAPTVTDIAPDEGPVDGGQTVTITGTDFVDGDTTVIIDGIVIPAADVTVIDSETLTFVTPANDEGPVDVTVTTPAGESDALTYTYVDDGSAAPRVTGIDPDEGPIAGGTEVTLTGAYFVGNNTTVTIGGVTIPASEVTVNADNTTATFTTPAHVEGPVEVTTTTGNGTSAPQTFTYIGEDIPADETTITDIDPDSGPVDGGTEVTLTGTCFVDGETTVTVDGVEVPAAVVTVIDGETLTYVAPAHEAGAVEVIVTSTCGESNGVTYTYTEDSDNAPVATDIAPNEGPTTGGTTVTIEGSGFVSGETTVTIGGITIDAGDVTVGGDGVTLTFVTPPHPEGAVEVTVTTPDGTTDPLTFTYIDEGIPGGETTITDIDPSEGPTEGGTTVILTGTCFIDGGTTVTVDGEPVDVIGVNEDGTEVQFVTPPHAAGEVEVTATSTECGESEPVTFTYIDGETPETPETPETTVPGPVDNGPIDNGPAGPGYQPISNPAGPYGNPSNPGTIARTGSETGPLVMGGILSIMAGGALLLARRRLA